MSELNRFELNNTTAQVQAAITAALNVLVTNSIEEGKYIVADGSGGVKFIDATQHKNTDGLLSVVKEGSSVIINVNVDNLKSELEIDDSALEKTAQKVAEITDANKTSDIYYPSVAAVVDYVATQASTSGIERVTYTSISDILLAFRSKAFSSGILYLTTIDNMPCIMIQVGDTAPSATSKVSMLILSGTSWITFIGDNGSEGIEDIFESSYDFNNIISNMATIDYVTEQITGAINGDY